ncbi:MAG: UDP-N-acetylmuramoyl-tripeptide--D-alanyl-D-alanine ligase [Lachnospiraceae bacterium]|nr:UDP-N-acetylmuramoyl-tripeptide--D-alanyl-D-alanine ligase [Lachnospiraceae bacterium]
MKNLYLKNIAKAVDGKLFLKDNNEEATRKEAVSVVIDSRLAQKDGIFIATKGERVDGHSFIPDVFDIGVLGVICEKEPEAKNGNYILVEDSFIALKKLAKYYKDQLCTKTVGIIGSVGKTSTKEMTASVLAQKYKVLKTEGNLNNEVGVPLTVLRIRDDHEAAVIEMGISDFGEMSRLGEIVRPDCVIMTNIGPCHLESLKDLDGVLKAKTEVFDHMKEGGIAILNGDDEKLSSINLVNGIEPVFYGRSDKNDIYAEEIDDHFLEGIDIKIGSLIGEMYAHVPLPGIHMVDNALAAAACGIVFGLDRDEITAGIKNVRGIKGRSNPIAAKDYLVVDDCYNANPRSMKAALDLLSKTEKRKVAILGDMFELGEDSDRLHGEIGEYAIDKKIDLLITAGKSSLKMYEAGSLRKDKNGADTEIRYYTDSDELKKALETEDILKKGDVILVKASHGMHFENIVNTLTE